MELRQAVLQDVVTLLDDDEAMQKLQKYVRRIKKEIAARPLVASPCCYTVRELEQRLQKVDAEIEEEKAVAHEEAMEKIKSKYPFLCRSISTTSQKTPAPPVASLC